jgi:hypothetical protein
MALSGAATLHAKVPTVEWKNLPDKDISPEGRAALAIDPELWKHAKTEHFVYHFMDEKESETVYIHAEVYYKYIKDFFKIAEDKWTKRSHIFTFTDKDMWTAFKARTYLKGFWVEGFATGWELFMFRNPHWINARVTLAHELSHVIVFRFMEGPLPRFLDEGVASFISTRAIATQLDYDDRELWPLKLIPSDDYMPLSELAEIKESPEDKKKRELFYLETNLMIRFIAYSYKGEKLYEFLHRMSKGEVLSKTIDRVFGIDLDEFEKQFKAFAVSK